MKERPMIFNDEMVRAILDGGKTQTRRPVKPEKGDPFRKPKKGELNPLKGVWYIEDGRGPGGSGTYHRCPYGQPGHWMWVQESFAMVDDRGIHIWTKPLVDAPANYAPVYRVDHDARSAYLHGGWRPSNHMPRWASRITLEITAVRVERVQDITVEDCIAEGLRTGFVEHDAKCHLLEQFSQLWDSIYGATEYAWANNPWVWVVEFRLNMGSN